MTATATRTPNSSPSSSEIGKPTYARTAPASGRQAYVGPSTESGTTCVAPSVIWRQNESRHGSGCRCR